MKNNKNIEKEDEIDLREIFLMFIKRKWWFIGTFLIILVAGLLYTFLNPDNYLLTYQMEVKQDYSNSYLSEFYPEYEKKLYPEYEKELNFISLADVPAIFKSSDVFKSLKNMGEDIDYNDLLKSEDVKITLNENTSVFNVTVSNYDYNLANEIAMTLVSSFEELIENKEKLALENIMDRIKIDIGDLEDENNKYEEGIIAEIDNALINLYEGYNKYILDYNVNLYNELDENKNSENISFYNTIIPPNKISDEIAELKEDKSLYRKKILENEIKIIDLNNLRESLLKDEDIILDRINLLSDTPLYSIESNRIRNIAIVFASSIIVGAIVVFVVNFLKGPKEGKKSK